MYYKVVAKCGDGLTSCCQNPFFPSDWKVKYKVGEFVTPILEGSKLLVFDDLQRATDFAFDVFGFGTYGEIWSCDVTNPNSISFLSRFDPDWILSYWKGFSSQLLMFAAPEGTVAVDSVKLIERMRRI
jgi:hypothetical protein